MTGLPMSTIVPFFIIGLVYLGFAQRTLDNMRLTDAQALLALVAIIVGSFLPSIPITSTLMIDIGGALIPTVIAVYLLTTADTPRERFRAALAALATGLLLFLLDRVLTPEPGTRPMLINIDPVWLPGIIAAVLGFGLGRSRRATFVGGTLGVVLSDLATALSNNLAGRTGTVIVLGGAGVVDSVLIAAVLGVTLTEIFEVTAKAVTGVDAPSSKAERSSGNILLRSGLIFAVVFALFAANTVGAVALGGPSEDSVSTIVDRYGTPITVIGRRVFRGDRYLTEDNLLYKVYRVKGSYAWALCMGRHELSEADLQTAPTMFQSNPVLPSAAPGTIAVYFTHNDESYVPTSGVSSVDDGHGGVHRVGQAFAEQLESLGILVQKSDSTHYPHDQGAYRRSRTTAMELLETRPAAVFDIHRDAAPIQAYTAQSGPEPVARIRFVVGRQNPSRAANETFAMTMKSVADKMHPGLMGGIFFGHGNYNQDLFPTMALAEVGAHTNSEEAAKRAAVLFAEVVASYFGIR